MRTKSGWTISAIRASNKAAGNHYFEPATMRFFDSRIEPAVYQGVGGVFFVTSEQFHGSRGSAPRQWSVCKFNPQTGDVDRFGPFNMMDRHEAMTLARLAAKGEAKCTLCDHVRHIGRACPDCKCRSGALLRMVGESEVNAG